MKILLIDFVELKFGYADLKILSKKRNSVKEEFTCLINVRFPV
jgi:hypothetical protein